MANWIELLLTFSNYSPILTMVRRSFAADTHSTDRLHRFDTALGATESTLFSPIAKVFVGFFLNLNFRYVRTQRHPFFIVT